jgi:hypothetical protein
MHLYPTSLAAAVMAVIIIPSRRLGGNIDRDNCGYNEDNVHGRKKNDIPPSPLPQSQQQTLSAVVEHTWKLFNVGQGKFI